MNQYADGRAFLNNEDDTESIRSNEPLPDEVPPQLADTPRPFLRSLGLEQPRSPADTVASSPEPRARQGQSKEKKKISGGQKTQNHISEKRTEVAATTQKRKPATPAPKNWVPLCIRERRRDAYFYSIDGKGFHVEE